MAVEKVSEGDYADDTAPDYANAAVNWRRSKASRRVISIRCYRRLTVSRHPQSEQEIWNEEAEDTPGDLLPDLQPLPPGPRPPAIGQFVSEQAYQQALEAWEKEHPL